MNRNDLRVIKTKRNITSALIRLLSEKEFEDITIQEIIDRAMINRSTFYKHYHDKYELAEAISADFTDRFQNMLIERATTLNPNNLLMGVDKLYEKLSEHRDMILAIWKIHTETVHVFDDMQALLKNSAREIIHKLSGKEATEYQAYLISVLMIMNLRFLLEKEDAYTKDRIITELNSLLQLMAGQGRALRSK